jgi:hypothetical protein
LRCGNQTGGDVPGADVLAQGARHLIAQVGGQLTQSRSDLSFCAGLG